MKTVGSNYAEKRIYLDHNATTPVMPEVLDFAHEHLDCWGNASSIHLDGRLPKALIRNSRKQIASWVGCKPLEIIFTSGGSEADNMAIQGVVRSYVLSGKIKERSKFITTTIEHPAVLKEFNYLESLGYDVKYINVSESEGIDLEQFRTELDETVALVSMMYINNETGYILPIKELCQMAHQCGALFHTDAVQALGKISFSVKELNVDYASFSAHKVYSLKGCGVLYQKTGVPLEPLIHGGAQERKRRAGTENVLAIGALGVASEILMDQHEDCSLRLRHLRDHFEQSLREKLEGVKVISEHLSRAPNTSSLIIENVDGESMLMGLDLKGVSVSTGAACSSGSPEPSPTLLALGITREQAQSSLRVSFGIENSIEEVDVAVEKVVEVVSRLRSIRNEESAKGASDEL
jgi:cysteine desulfurase